MIANILKKDTYKQISLSEHLKKKISEWEE